jgi:hypothetical protein
MYYKELKDILKKRLVLSGEGSYELVKDLVTEDSVNNLVDDYVWRRVSIDPIIFINRKRGDLSNLKRLEVAIRVLGEL